MVSKTSQIMPFDLELILSLESVMTTPHGYYTIQMSPSRQASYQNSTGLCTDLTTPFLLNDNRARYAVLCRPSMRPLRKWSGPVQGGQLVPNYPPQRTGTPRPHPRIWRYLPVNGVFDSFAPIYQYGTDTPFLGHTSTNRHSTSNYPHPLDGRCIRPPGS
jgi:hypothetical protein